MSRGEGANRRSHKVVRRLVHLVGDFYGTTTVWAGVAALVPHAFTAATLS